MRDGYPVRNGSFNNKYLLDSLRACESDKIKLEINGRFSPMKIVPHGRGRLLFLVLPVRLKNEN
jgi:DNA polymerase III sliding clamp (beta) subunit (PCNA family)